MTDEYTYYGEPEPDDQWQQLELEHWRQQNEATEINHCESHFCVLTRHDMLRVRRAVEVLRSGRRESGLRHLAVLAVIKHYGDCFASPWTIAREAGCRDIETLKGYIEDLIRVAAVERVTVRGRDALRAVASDGPPKPYAKVHRAWMERWVANRDVWSVCSRILWKRGLRRRGRRPKADGIEWKLTPTVAAVLWIVQSRGRTFNATAGELAAECGLSRDQFSEIARLLRDCGLISFRRAGNGTLWTTDFSTARLSEKSCGAPARLSEKSCQEVDVKQKQVDVDPKTRTGSKPEARRAQTSACEPSLRRPAHSRVTYEADLQATHAEHNHSHEALEPERTLSGDPPSHDDCECTEGWIPTTDAKGCTRMKRCSKWMAWSKWQSEQEVAKQRELEEARWRNSGGFGFLSDFGPSLRPQLAAGPPPTIKSESRRTPRATPGWSKATSGPRRVILNGALYQLHQIIIDSLELRELQPQIWRRITGMLCRMPHGTADEFRDAMTEAAEQLSEKQDVHPDGSFYCDVEKSTLWAVGRATGCSYWID